MKKNCQHYWRIHSRVTRRLWTDLPIEVRETIASDVNHETEEFKWFAAKVEQDATFLFEDVNYYDNSEYSFRLSKTLCPQHLLALAA